MAGAWGPWVTHDGMSVPLPAGTVVFVLRENGSEHAGTVSGSMRTGWIWSFCEALGMPGAKVLRYRVRRSDALMRLVDLVETLPARSNEEREPA